MEDALTKMQQGATELRFLENKIGNEGAKALAEALATNTALQTLDLSWNAIGGEGAKALAEALAANTALQTLALEGNMIGAEGAKALAKAVGANSTLQTLDLSRNEIGDEGAKALAEALAANTTLQMLIVSWNTIGDEGVKALAEALGANKTLQTLDLNHNKIGAEGAKALAEALVANTALQTLDLSNNPIGAEGVKALAKALGTNTALQKLILAYMGKSMDLGALSVGLARNTSLKELILTNNPVVFTNDDCANMPHMESLILRNCFLKSLPRNLCRMRSLRSLDLAENYDLEIPGRLKNCQSREAVLELMDFLLTSDHTIRRVNLFVLGHGGAGKTTLLHTLESNKAPRQHELSSTPSTVGVDMPDSDAVSRSLDTRSHRVDFTVWDFAGQLEYLTTHQFFLSPKRAVVVVLVDLSLPAAEQKRQMRHWIDLLCSTMENAKDAMEPVGHRVLLVGAKSDLIESVSLQARLAELKAEFIDGEPRLRWHGSDVTATSSKTGAGFSAFKKAVRAAADECIGVAPKVPKLYAECHEQVLSRRHLTRSGAVMSVEKFREFLGEHDPGGTMNAVIEVLSHIGTVLYAPRAGGVCINPALLPKIMSCFVLSSEHNRTRFGRLEAPSAIVPVPEALRRLRSLPEFADRNDDECLRALAALSEWDLAFELSADEALSYGQSGFLFPSLRPYGELLLLPAGQEVSMPAARERWIGVQVTLAGGGPIGRLFVLLQTHTRPLHDHRFKLYANGVVLRSARHASRALLRLVDSSRAYVIVAGDQCGAMMDELKAIAAQVEATCGGVRLEWQSLCPVCVQRGGGGERTYPLLNADGKCASCDAVVSRDDVEREAKAVVSSQHLHSVSSAVYMPGGGDPSFLSSGKWTQHAAIGDNGFPFATTTLTKDESDARRAAEYRAVSDRFYRFMGKEAAHNLVVTSVEVVHNAALTAAFERCYREFQERTMRSGGAVGGDEVGVSLLSSAAAAAAAAAPEPSADPVSSSSAPVSVPEPPASASLPLVRTCQHPRLHIALRRMVEERVPSLERGRDLLQKREKSAYFKALVDEAATDKAAQGVSAQTVAAELLVVLDEYDDEWRAWMMREFERYPDRVSGNEGVNLVMAFQGGAASGYMRKASSGNLLPAEVHALAQKGVCNPPLDGGYFGCGIYFTQYPSYGQMYTAGNHSLMLSWLALGRWPVANPGNPYAPGDDRTLYGRPAKPGFDSHYLLVRKTRREVDGKTEVADEGFPCLPDEGVDGDEICVFRKDQILPRYIVNFHDIRASNAAAPAAAVTPAVADPPLSSSSHIVVWVDPDESGLNRSDVDQMVSHGKQAGREVVVIQASSSDEARSFLERNRAVLVEAMRKKRLRFITNRYRKGDGDEFAGANWIQWVRTGKNRNESGATAAAAAAAAAQPSSSWLWTMLPSWGGSDTGQWSSVPVLLYCSLEWYPRVAGLHAPREATFVSYDSGMALNFGAFGELPRK